jgi:hypothetical protein
MANEISTEIHDDAPTPNNTLAMIARAVMDPAVSVEKMVELNNLHERIMDRAAKEAFTKAFAAAMMQMPSITKNGAIRNNSGAVQSRFSKWEDIDRVTRPILRANGLVLSFELGEAPNKALTVCAVLTHVGGHQERSGPMPLPVDATGNKSPVQGTGSSMSYGKRYATIAMLNIITEGEDDDGRGGGTKIEDSDAAQRLTYEEAKMVADSQGVSAYAEHFTRLARAQKLYLTGTKAADGVKSLHEEIKDIAEKSDARAGVVS